MDLAHFLDLVRDVPGDVTMCFTREKPDDVDFNVAISQVVYDQGAGYLFLMVDEDRWI